MSHPPLVVLFDPDSLAPEHASAIAASGYRTESVGDHESARAAIDRDAPAALVIVEGRAGPSDHGLARAARGRGIPVLGLLDGPGPGEARPDGRAEYDTWARRSCTPGELSERLGSALAGRRGPAEGAPPPIDVALLQMIVHDLRNPLNVIGLTLRVIEQMPANLRAPIQEDLTFLRDNAHQIEKMLVLVGDVCRLGELTGAADPFPFDPGRMLDELLAERASRSQERAYPARLDLDPTTPRTVNLDPTRVRLALQCALANASGAADRPISVRSWGEDGRWRVAVSIDRPPPSTVASHDVRPDRYERLNGSHNQREALDIAVAAWFARQFGGSVRLEVTPGQGSTILLDLPVGPA